MSKRANVEQDPGVNDTFNNDNEVLFIFLNNFTKCFTARDKVGWVGYIFIRTQ